MGNNQWSRAAKKCIAAPPPLSVLETIFQTRVAFIAIFSSDLDPWETKKSYIIYD